MSWDEIFVLIARAQTGDRAAFGELVQRFQPAVYAVALARLRDPNEATELAQEVFIHAMTKISQLRDPHCFVGWLRQITVRMAINRVTRKAPVQGVEPEVLQNAPGVALAQALMPRNLGTALGLMNGVGFGLGSLGVALVGFVVTRSGPDTALAMVSFVPLLAAATYYVVDRRIAATRAAAVAATPS